MYHSFFGLRHPPFPEAIRSGGYFDGAPFGTLVGALAGGLARGDGVLKFIGTAGSGKTTVCHALRERIRRHQQAFYVSAGGESDALRAVARALGIAATDDVTGLSLVPALMRQLEALHSQGGKGVLILDDCQAIEPQVLEQIRMLCDQSRFQHPPLQLVLCGRPELDRTLAQDSLRALRSRVVHHLGLPALTPAAVHAYLAAHLRRAGYFGPDLFSPGVSKELARASGGIPRTLNELAQRTLMAAFCCNTHTVQRVHVRMATKGELRRPWKMLDRLAPAHT